MTNELYAFGKPVPEDFLNELIKEYGSEQVNQQFIETLLWYEYLDNE